MAGTGRFAAMNEAVVKDALQAVLDPELGANIVELGLVEEIRFADDTLTVQIGTTSPSCPMGQHLVDAARLALSRRFPQLKSIDVLLAWNPQWSPERMSPELRERFGWA